MKYLRRQWGLFWEVCSSYRRTSYISFHWIQVSRWLKQLQKSYPLFFFFIYTVHMHTKKKKKKDFSFLIGWFEFHFCVFHPEICSVFSFSYKKVFPIFDCNSPLFLNFIISFLRWHWLGRDKECTQSAVGGYIMNTCGGMVIFFCYVLYFLQ